jgi:uncharacterized membrane protein HdeD (DUF308 family)
MPRHRPGKDIMSGYIAMQQLSAKWWMFFVCGISALGIAAGAFASQGSMIGVPGIDPHSLARLFAIWMIASGIAELCAAIAMRNVIRHEFWIGLLGVPTLAIGWHVAVRPDIAFMELMSTVAFYGVLAGVSLIGFALRIKSTGAATLVPVRERLSLRLWQSQRSADPRMCSVLTRRLISKRSRAANKDSRSI